MSATPPPQLDPTLLIRLISEAVDRAVKPLADRLDEIKVELRRADDRLAQLVPREEVDRRFREMHDKIDAAPARNIALGSLGVSTLMLLVAIASLFIHLPH